MCWDIDGGRVTSDDVTTLVRCGEEGVGVCPSRGRAQVDPGRPRSPGQAAPRRAGRGGELVAELRHDESGNVIPIQGDPRAEPRGNWSTVKSLCDLQGGCSSEEVMSVRWPVMTAGPLFDPRFHHRIQLPRWSSTVSNVEKRGKTLT